MSTADENDSLKPEQVASLQASAELFRSRVLAQRQVAVDYDAEGLRWVDAFLQQAHEKGGGLAPAMQQVISAFVGECIVRNLGGEWVLAMGQPCVRVGTGSNAWTASPANKVAKRVENGPEDSVLAFYEGLAALASVGQTLTPGQQRLLEFQAQAGHRVHVPIEFKGQVEWRAVGAIQNGWLDLQGAGVAGAKMSIPLAGVQSFYVLGPADRLVHTEWLASQYFATLPEDVRRAVEAGLTHDPTLSLKELERGRRFLAVAHGPGANKDGGYATSVTNVGTRPIRITRFGGYLPDSEGAWKLASVTGKHYTAQEFIDWYGQAGEWLQPGQTVCDPSNWGEPPVLWAYFGLTDLGDSVVAGAELDKLPGGRHHIAPHAPDPAMEQAIQSLRRSVAQKQERLNPLMLAALLAPRPPGLPPGDPLSEVFEHQSLLLKEGRVVWGSLIQANSLLFAPGPLDLPALLAYSEDPYFDARPGELREVARTAFRYKGTTQQDEELKALAAAVTDELDRSMGVELPRVLNSRAIAMTTFWVFRKHIPNGVLDTALFPVLVHASTPAVTIVPMEFWPMELIVLWKAGRLA